MAPKRLAAHQKTAARQRAALALMDESGVLMAPVLRRSWALRCHSPTSKHPLSKKREKVSVAGALWMPSSRDRLVWSSQTLVNAYYDSQCVAVFVQALLEEAGGRLVLVWDGGSMHRGSPIHDLLLSQKGQLVLEPLPPHAPELAKSGRIQLELAQIRAAL